MKKLLLIALLGFASVSICLADDTYLGKLSANPYGADSTANAYGTYGSEYSSKSINNQYGEYGSEYSNKAQPTRMPPMHRNFTTTMAITVAS